MFVKTGGEGCMMTTTCSVGQIPEAVVVSVVVSLVTVNLLTGDLLGRLLVSYYGAKPLVLQSM